MKHLNLTPYAALLLLAALFSACSGPSENSTASNTSAPQKQANSNSAPQPQIAQGNPPANAAPGPAPLAVQPIPPPTPDAKSPANSPANTATASTAVNARAPKLVVSGKKIDYGKQPQEKTLVRAIIIKNEGRADLNIESVVPS